MNQIPDWWLYLTGFASLMFVVLLVVLVLMVVQLIKQVRELQAPMTRLLADVHALVPEVRALVGKVDALTSKVDAIADSARGTVELVGSKTQGIVSSVDSISHVLSGKLQPYAPLIGAVMTGLKLFTAFRESRAKSSGPKVRVKAPALTDGKVEVKKGKV